MSKSPMILENDSIGSIAERTAAKRTVMPLTPAPKIWTSGTLVDWGEATHIEPCHAEWVEVAS